MSSLSAANFPSKRPVPKKKYGPLHQYQQNEIYLSLSLSIPLSPSLSLSLSLLSIPQITNSPNFRGAGVSFINS